MREGPVCTCDTEDCGQKCLQLGMFQRRMEEELPWFLGEATMQTVRSNCKGIGPFARNPGQGFWYIISGHSSLTIFWTSAWGGRPESRNARRSSFQEENYVKLSCFGKTIYGHHVDISEWLRPNPQKWECPKPIPILLLIPHVIFCLKNSVYSRNPHLKLW